MKEHVKYSRARNQLYGIKVAFRELKEKMPRHHRTAPLEHTLELLETVINSACDCFEAGNVLEVLVNVYVPTALPGFEAMVEEDLMNAKFDREVQDYDIGAPFDDKGDLDAKNIEECWLQNAAEGDDWSV